MGEWLPTNPTRSTAAARFLAGQDLGAFIDVPEEVAASTKERKNPVSFGDHYSQVGLFFRSLSPVEQDHVIQAYTFELGKCYEKSIRERQLAALANVDAGLCAAVAKGLGLPAPQARAVSWEQRTTAGSPCNGRTSPPAPPSSTPSSLRLLPLRRPTPNPDLTRKPEPPGVHWIHRRSCCLPKRSVMPRPLAPWPPARMS